MWIQTVSKTDAIPFYQSTLHSHTFQKDRKCLLELRMTVICNVHECNSWKMPEEGKIAVRWKNGNTCRRQTDFIDLAPN